MDEKGVIKTSVSMPPILWNEVQKVIEADGISFSRWIQKASRLLLRTREMQDVKEFVSALNDYQLGLLRKEIKKRD